LILADRLDPSMEQDSSAIALFVLLYFTSLSLELLAEDRSERRSFTVAHGCEIAKTPAS
jgi:hypothetical protein